MHTRKLGKTGIKVSEIGFGGANIGLPYGMGVHIVAAMFSKDKTVRLLQAALESGINFFDTARLYGESEAIMGEAFQGRRQEAILSTKCASLKKTKNLSDRRSLKITIQSSLHESMAFLRTAYTDVFMLPEAGLELLRNDDILEIFTELKKSGKTRAIGASVTSAAEARLAIEKGWDVVQLDFNPLDLQHAANFELAEEKGAAIVVRPMISQGPAGVADTPAPAIKFALSFNQVSSVLVDANKLEYLDKALLPVSGKFPTMNELIMAKQPDCLNFEFLNFPK